MIEFCHSPNLIYKRILTRVQHIHSTWEKGLIDFSRNNHLPEWRKKGAQVKIIAPVTIENQETAQQLSEYGEVRHIPATCLENVIIDGKYLLAFNTDFAEEEKSELTSLENTLYTNDFDYANKNRNMFNYIWETCRPYQR